MPHSVVSYDPARIDGLIARVRDVSEHLAQRPCADRLAADAASVASLVRSHVVDGWLPQLEAIAASRALLDPVDIAAPASPTVPDTGVISAVVDRLTPAEREYFQGFVDASATSVASELWLFDAHGDYATDRLPHELAALDDTDDWQWLAQLYLVEQYHRMVADGSVTLSRNGDAYWVDPVDLTDQASAISADIVLAAVTFPGNMRQGGAISEATAHTAASPMPAPRLLTSEEPPLRPAGVPEAWEPRLANNGHGWVWQLPGSGENNANSIRVMDHDVNGRHMDGYVVFTNEHNQPLTIDGKSGTRAETHIPRTADGSYPLPAGWPEAHTAIAPR